MNPHRQHYFEANEPRKPLSVTEPTYGPGEIIATVLLVIVALGAVAAQLAKDAGKPEADVTPVRSPIVVTYNLPPLEVEEARIEAAILERCGLSLPIAPR